MSHRRSAWAVVAAAVVLVVGVLVVVGRSDDRVSASTTGTRPSAASSTSRLPSTVITHPTTASTATTGPTTTTAPPRPRTITLAFAGDLLLHGPVNRRAASDGAAHGVAYDYAPMLAPMAPIISGADVAICHLEVQLAPPGQAVTTYPSFGAPAEIVDAIKATGYDGCSNASNHSLDRGVAGITATLDRFDQDGLHHAGTARSAAEAGTTTTYDVDGVEVAHLSYAYGFNGYAIPAQAPWAVNQIDPTRIKADAARARAGGADLVVVSLHWGTEYRSEPSSYQREIASQLVPSPDIDLIVGHHAHVVQPIGRIGGTFVIWGMGNQLANQPQVPRSDGLTAIATANQGTDGRWSVATVEAVPTWVEPGDFRVLPVVATLADPATPPGLRAELSASYDRTITTVVREGIDGLVIQPKP